MLLRVLQQDIEVPDGLWKEYMETGHFVDTADGVFELERIIKTGDFPRDVLQTIREITTAYQPPTREEIKEAVRRKKENGLWM